MMTKNNSLEFMGQAKRCSPDLKVVYDDMADNRHLFCVLLPYFSI